MIKVLLIDDEPLARQIVREYLSVHADIEIVQECGDGFEGVKAIQQHQPDLIFLDIQMPKINGFEMLELIEDCPSIIFTTAFDEFAIKAFENNAIDYLLKPFSQERFDKAISKWKEQVKVGTAKAPEPSFLETATSQPPQNQRVVVKTGSKIKIIPTDDIHYLEADDDYVKIYTQEGCFLKNKTMAFFEKTLDPNSFVRTHRSFIVNVKLITRIDPYEKEQHIAHLKTGASINVSKNGYAKLKQVLGI